MVSAMASRSRSHSSETREKERTSNVDYVKGYKSMKTDPAISWEPVSAGPLLAFHAGCVVGNAMYVHGGIMKPGDLNPSNKLYKYDISSSFWQEIREPGSPTLSHHACVLLRNRYIIFVGGWDGKSRTGNVFIYDLGASLWIFPKVDGFPAQAGLSSHSATLLSTDEILVIGRDGGLHMQRRHGDSYILSCNPEKGVCTYREYTSLLSSRSGHTANILGNVIYIIGGRRDKQMERILGFKSAPDWPVCVGPILSKLNALLGEKISPVSKLPCGRKNHVTVVGPGFIFVHGGETFDGKSREPVGDMYLVTIKPTVEWFKVRGSKVGRAGHVCFCDGEKIIIHGGLGARNQVCGDVQQLKV